MAFKNCTRTSCEKIFFADTGALIVKSVGGAGERFAGTLNDVIFHEVVWDSDAGEAGDYVPGGSGDSFCAHGLTFDQPIVEKVADPACVAAGSGSLLGDNIGDFSLQNCNGDMVTLHSRCGGVKALRIMLISGWCTACALSCRWRPPTTRTAAPWGWI